MKSNHNLITALYTRLSQEDLLQGESNSIRNQKLILQKHAGDHGFHNCQFYVDDGYSGADFNRPDFKRMMADIEAGKIGTVIVKDQSRLGRDYLQTGMLMEITFPQYDVRFIAINDGVDSANGVSDFSGIKTTSMTSMPEIPVERSGPSSKRRENVERESAQLLLTDLCVTRRIRRS